MKKIILIVIGTLFFSPCFSKSFVAVEAVEEETNSIIENDKKEKQKLTFKPVELDSMLCIDYSYATFDDEYGSIIDYGNADKSIMLSEENVRKMFFGNKDSVQLTNVWNEEYVYTRTAEESLEENSFYLHNVVSSNKKWTAIIIEVIEKYSDFSEKFLVTIDKNQNLISKCLIAFYGRCGTYTCCETDEDGNIETYEDEDIDEEGNIIIVERQICGRCPWYTGAEGCIGKDLTIGVSRGNGSEGIGSRKFIDDKGNIVKIK